ncbi:DNA-directed DNA/RNA polymerase mu [Gracilariopsis chorda]|uniref:DNA polymerase n=1 Tax=Gracilariopsis chorda TaxID=448386 RepID=A0A2V3IZS7_9FLOR|nr:DNA-directed DNA/RNA polymerase mu [Gracilariopsis chorda]|eukprot:PXF47662.1 DNA-directed DNA/RNA polymerase mu [Gracilariopsis chorda]
MSSKSNTSDRDEHGPHAKRPRKGGLSYANQGLKTDVDFLSRGDSDRPIAVILTPLRERQQQILSRNLKAAGAKILQFDERKSEDEQPATEGLVVVTDNPKKARRVVENREETMKNVVFVETKWATRVLAEQRWVPIQPYVLEQTKATQHESSTVPESDEINLDTALEASSKSRKNADTLPVWCRKKTCENSDIAEKREFLEGLPRFLCERCTITQAIYEAPNNELCKLLEIIEKKRRLEQAGGSEAEADIRARAYRRASAALKCVPFKLQTVQDAQALHSLGPRVLSIVQEYLMNGTVREVQLMETDHRLRILTQFQSVYGLGYVSARRYYDELRITSMDQLVEKSSRDESSEANVLVRYLGYIDKLAHLRWKDAVAVVDMVSQAANVTGEDDLHLRFQLCGGFRRGESSGHDVDILYCRQEKYAHDCSSVMKELISRLERTGLIVKVLRESSDTNGWNEVRYHARSSRAIFRYAHDVVHAIAKYKGCFFRLDLVGVRDAFEFCFTTISWSGSTPFQRDLRWWCEKKKGWTFNEHGVFDRESGQRVKLNPEPKSEMDVFAALGLTYRAPFERSC